MASDQELRDRVLAEMRWDARVPHEDIAVDARGGVVRLTGSVGSVAERLAGRHAAHRVGGVLDVVDEIVVRHGGSHEDLDVARAVRSALESHAFVPAGAIESTVADGEVTLTGTLSRRFDRDEADRVVRKLRGVRHVVNRIRVEPPAVGADQVHAAITAALERHARHTAHRVTVSVEDGVATLHGNVHSWGEMHAVLETARHVPGVRRVEDRMAMIR